MHAFNGLTVRGDDVIQILPQTAVLLAHAAGLIGLAVWQFRRLFLSGSLWRPGPVTRPCQPAPGWSALQCSTRTPAAAGRSEGA